MRRLGRRDARSRSASTPGVATSRCGAGSKARAADLLDLARAFEDDGVAGPDRDRDRPGRHARAAPTWSAWAEVLAATSIPGDRLRRRRHPRRPAGPARASSRQRRGLSGAIVGRAIYEGEFTVHEAVAAARRRRERRREDRDGSPWSWTWTPAGS